jgi:hypothetical protein
LAADFLLVLSPLRAVEAAIPGDIHVPYTEEEPLDITIRADRNDCLTVSNNLREKPHQKESFKIGLENIRQRYHLFTDRQIEVVKDKRFTVKLPLL